MRNQDGFAALGLDVLDRRHDPVDPRCIGHNTVFDGHVYVDADQNPFAIKVHVIKGFPGHFHLHSNAPER